MKRLKEIVDVLSQIVALKCPAQDGGPGSGIKGHTTNHSENASGANGSKISEGQDVVINPRYRDGASVARVIEVRGDFVVTSEGSYHISDLADPDHADSSWLDEKTQKKLWG